MSIVSLFRASAIAVSVLLAAFAAKADVVYAFNSTQVGAFGAGPYGTVTLHANGSGGIDFTVALRSDMNFVNTGGPHMVFAFNALGVAASDISNIAFNGAAAAGLGFTVVAPGENQPFGTSFSFGFDCTVNILCDNGAPGQTLDPLSFTVANAAYTDFGFTANGTTASFAADVICMRGGCNGGTGAIGVTGPGVLVPRNVPEPGSLALAGLALVAAGLGRRQALR